MSEIIKDGDKVIVKPGQDVVASMANEFRTELHSIIKDTPDLIQIDLNDVEMVDSVGIGVIIATHNSINKAGGTLKVTNVSKDIFSLFTTMRLNRHFDVEQAS